jgi:hypothetical protein
VSSNISSSCRWTGLQVGSAYLLINARCDVQFQTGDLAAAAGCVRALRAELSNSAAAAEAAKAWCVPAPAAAAPGLDDPVALAGSARTAALKQHCQLLDQYEAHLLQVPHPWWRMRVCLGGVWYEARCMYRAAADEFCAQLWEVVPIAHTGVPAWNACHT